MTANPLSSKMAFALFNRIYRKLARLAANRNDVQALLEVATEFLPSTITHNQGNLPRHLGCSFRAEIASHSRTWLTQPNRVDLPEWGLDNKIRAYAFMEALGVRVPKVLVSGASVESILISPLTVIKPEEGFLSNGVFIIDEHGKGYDVKQHIHGLSDDDIRRSMKDYLSKGLVLTDLWHVEEVITSPGSFPPVDFKFYCFYGECPLAAKVSRTPERGTSFQYFDRAGREVSGNHPSEKVGGRDIGDDDFRLAEMISLEIPTPFLRLDFLAGDTLCFGEIGNLVGQFSGFDTEQDRFLGRAFIDARGRLFDDLRRGRRFEIYDGIFSK